MNLALSAVEVIEDRAQLHQALLSRRHAIANEWHTAIARTSFAPFRAVEMRQRLVELTEDIIALLLTESFDHRRAEAIGASLARFHYLEPEALGRTQQVLAQQLVEGLTADQIVELQPRLTALLGGLATGFSRQARETVLAEQEWIHGALARELRRAGEALRKAYAEVEQQVQERTAELRETNESLQREIAERQQAEAALRESEERFRGVFENATIGLYRTTPDGHILMANPALVRMFGYSSFEELAQRNLEEEGYEPEYPRSAFKQRIESEGEIIGLESAWIRHDGSTLFVRESARVIRDKAGNTLYYEGTVENITERRRAEESLKESLAQIELAKREWEFTADSLPQFVCLLDHRGRIIRTNRTVERWNLGRIRQVKGLGVHELFHHDCTDPACYLEAFWLRTRKELARCQPAECEAEDKILDRHFHIQVRPILAQMGGGVVEEGTSFAVAIVSDITERKLAEEALRESEEHFRSITQTATDAIITIDSRGNIFFWNYAAESIFGYSADEVVGKPLTLIIPKRFLEPHRNALQQAVSTRKPKFAGKTMEFFGRRKDGSEFPLELSLATWKTGEDTFFTGIIRDITERKLADEALRKAHDELERRVEERTAELAKANEALRAEIAGRVRAEEALRASEKRYHSLFEGVPVGLYRTTPAGQILDVNPALVEMLGLPDQETAREINAVNGYANPADRTRWQALIDRQGLVRDFEVQWRRHDGTIMWVKESARSLQDDKGRILCYEGVVEDITERKRVEEELIRLSSAVKTSVDSIVIIDVEGKVIDVNEAALRMYGTDDKEDLIGQHCLNLVAPEHREKALAGIKFVLEKGHDRSQGYEAITKAGRRIPIELSAAAMKDADGKPIGIVTIARDITERKQAEEHMMRTERLAAMGRLAAALAHEINNPLQAIGNSLELALDFPLQEKERQEYLQAARREIERLMVLTDRMLNFARPPLVERQTTSVADVLRHALALVSEELHNSDIRVSLDLPDVIRPVPTSSSHLLQVFLNLMINAIEAMPDGGELSIGVRLAGDQVEVTFADSGPGIPSDAMARLFEPFHTTKENGTGLGLATSFSIIQQHGGTMTAGNAPGGGAVFTVALPIAPLGEPYVAERS